MNIYNHKASLPADLPTNRISGNGTNILSGERQLRWGGMGFPRRFGVAILAVFLGLAPVISSAEPPEGRGPGVKKPLGWAKGRILVMPRAGLPVL